MSHSLLGRLPPLQAIGRSKCIDLDDPPPTSSSDDDPEEEDLVDIYLQSLDKDPDVSSPLPLYRFEPDHAGLASTALLRAFRILRPGGQYCKRVGSEVTGFTHCQKSVSFALKHRELDRLLETRAQLDFTRDLLSRISAFGVFLSELQQLVREESQTWYEICQDSLATAPTTKLELLCGLCEELRMQLNQWNSIKQAMNSDRHLRPLLPSLCSSVRIVRRRLAEMSESAIVWLGRLILFGLKVLAHCDLERIGQDALWNIARGLEEYNITVSATRLSLLLPADGPNDLPPPMSKPAGSVLPPPSAGGLLRCSFGRRNGVVPLTKVLRLIASERAKYAAASARVYFTGSKDFLALVKNARLPLYSWSARTSTYNPERTRTKTTPPDTVLDFLIVTADLLAPDLSSEISPLIDFARRESTFIGRFLQIICHSTSLIRKQSNQPAAANDGKNDPPTARTNIPRLRQLRPKTIAFVTEPPTTTNTNAGFNSDLEPTDSQQRVVVVVDAEPKGAVEVAKSDTSRKTVSWSDSSLAASIQQVTQDYVRILWMNFADHLYKFLVCAEWGSAKDAKDALGSIMLCPDSLTMVVKCMVQHASVGDTFPLGSRFALAGLSLRLHASVACAAWDIALNSSLASAATDKCQAISHLTGESSITLTGKQLYETYQPLHSLLSTLVSITDDQTGGALSCSDRVAVGVLVMILKRLTVSADLSFSWCSDKMLQLMASRAVASFLLVAFADLQILAEQNDEAFGVCQQLRDQFVMALNNTTDGGGSAVWDIDKSLTQANEKRCHLQALISSSRKQYHQMCLSSARDFFQNEMPAGKEWKRKGGEVLPIQHLEYIERAVDSLLEPVVAGVNRLRPTGQLEALTTVITNICDAWTSNILTKKIRFSYHGACQLELDILYLRTWLTSYISETELCQRLMSLDFLRYLDCVVILLKQQPTGHQGRRSGSRVRQQPTRCTEKGFKDACVDGTQSISNTSTCTPSSDTNDDGKNGVLWDSKMAASGERTSRSYASVSASTSLEDGDLEGQAVPHKEQWLALRVNGGSRNWPKLGSCFNNTSA